MEADVKLWTRTGATFALAAIAASPAVALQDDPLPVEAQAAATEDPEEELQELMDEFDEAMSAFFELYEKAEGDEKAQSKLFEEQYPDANDYAERFLDFAGRNGASEHSAKALTWVVQRGSGDSKLEALTILMHDHLERESMGVVASILV